LALGELLVKIQLKGMDGRSPSSYIYGISPLFSTTDLGLYWIIWVVKCYIRIITYFKPLHPNEKL